MHMKLAHMMFHHKFLGHLAIAVQIIVDDPTDPQIFDQGLQKRSHRLWINFIHLPYHDRTDCSQIHRDYHGLLLAPSQWV